MDRKALRVVAEDRPGLLRDLSTRIADAGANLTWVSVTVHSGEARLLLEIDGPVPALDDFGIVEEVASAAAVWGKRVIVVGGGAQVAQVAMGAISAKGMLFL